MVTVEYRSFSDASTVGLLLKLGLCRTRFSCVEQVAFHRIISRIVKGQGQDAHLANPRLHTYQMAKMLARSFACSRRSRYRLSTLTFPIVPASLYIEVSVSWCGKWSDSVWKNACWFELEGRTHAPYWNSHFTNHARVKTPFRVNSSTL